MEKQILSPMESEGTIGVFAWSACDHEGCTQVVAVKREKTKGDKYVRMRAKQENAHT